MTKILKICILILINKKILSRVNSTFHALDSIFLFITPLLANLRDYYFLKIIFTSKFLLFCFYYLFFRSSSNSLHPHRCQPACIRDAFLYTCRSTESVLRRSEADLRNCLIHGSRRQDIWGRPISALLL